MLGSSPASGEDGLLQVREIRDLPLRTELVTLSACDTGSGKLLGQEGIASLERAFLLAGAKAVIASLWPADDTFTIALMKRLYQHLINGSDKGAALREAKLSWIFSGNSATKPFRSIGPASRLSVTAQQQSSSKHSPAHLSFPKSPHWSCRESAQQCGAPASLIDNNNQKGEYSYGFR